MNAPLDAGQRASLEAALQSVTLDDKYTLERGRAYMSGIQALVRLPMLQQERDRAAGLNTAGFISGYRGSPLGGLDLSLWKAKRHLAAHRIVFQPGINEDLAATAVWGSQQVNLYPGAKYDGVFSMWYGKGPGVDRTGDVFKHANSAGSAPHGGVLVLAGDDHAAKSSTLAHQSEHIFKACGLPVLFPSNVQEYLDFGLHGWAMSRYSGLWVALKCVTDVVESSASVDIDPHRTQIVLPTDFVMPDGGLNDARLADEERIVLAAAAEHLHDALDLGLAPDQRIDAPVLRHLVQVLRELRERRFLLRARVLAFRVRVGGLRGFAAARLRDAVRDEVDDVEARHALLLQVVDRVRILLAEDRDEHVRARDFLLAVRRRLHVHDRPLDHALKAERRLRVDIVGAGNGRRVVVDEIAQVLTQVLDVRRARAQHLGCRRIIQQGQQKMLDRNELMPRLARFHERHVQADFQFLGNHASSITHCSGCPACRAWVTTCSTLVDAMSRV